MTKTIEQILSPLAECKYIPEKKWWVWVDTNNVIRKTVSSIFELSNLNTSSNTNLRLIRVGNVSEELYDVLRKVANKSYYIGVIDESIQEIYSYKFKARVIDGIKQHEHYVIDKSIHAEFMLKDEDDKLVNYDGPITLKCIGNTGVNKQYTLQTKNDTLEPTGDHSREYTMNINDTLIVTNADVDRPHSIRVTCNFVVNGELYPLSRYVTFNKHA